MNNFFNTPILFLIFNRPETTQQVFNAIRKVKPKLLFVAADGPRRDKDGDKEKCEITREIIKQVDWECEVKTLFRNENLGCGKSVSLAITWFFENVEEGIILEDDCLPDNSFFMFCQEMLVHYRNSNDVMFVSGDNFQNGKKRGDTSYYFSSYNNIWGWATWKRTWDLYDFKLSNIKLNEIDNILKQYFSSKIQISYWKNIFKRMKSSSPIDTWDYQLTFSIWKNKGISVTPNTNLVSNIGFGSEATHTVNKNNKIANHPVELMDFPLKYLSDFKINNDADKYLDKTIFKINRYQVYFLNKVVQIIKKMRLTRIFLIIIKFINKFK